MISLCSYRAWPRASCVFLPLDLSCPLRKVEKGDRLPRVPQGALDDGLRRWPPPVSPLTQAGFLVKALAGCAVYKQPQPQCGALPTRTRGCWVAPG